MVCLKTKALNNVKNFSFIIWSILNKNKRQIMSRTFLLLLIVNGSICFGGVLLWSFIFEYNSKRFCLWNWMKSRFGKRLLFKRAERQHPVLSALRIKLKSDIKPLSKGINLESTFFWYLYANFMAGNFIRLRTETCE